MINPKILFGWFWKLFSTLSLIPHSFDLPPKDIRKGSSVVIKYAIKVWLKNNNIGAPCNKLMI